MDRQEMVARFSFPTPVPDADLLHPYLTAACALVWQWAGREALHAGAFALDGQQGAILLFGPKQSGKSSTLAHLARAHGSTVLADDLSVIDEHQVLAGPRCIDMRSGDDGEAVRDRQRLRIDLGETPSSLPVAATVVLRWADELSVESVPPSERLSELASQRSYPPLAGDPAALLWLASLPMLALSRPRDVAALPEGARILLDRLARVT